MSTVYLVRHGQAGTRDAYDSLSEVGQRQAQLLGEHFVSQGIQFSKVSSGSLSRQRQTAEGIQRAYGDASIPCASVSIDPGWNEFDLGQVYREIAPQLCAEDAEFRDEWERMCEQVRASGGASTASVHRKWLPCDTKVVNAWISGRYRYSGESWGQFRERIAAQQRVDGTQSRDNILVVTSATPVAIWMGLSLDIQNERVLRLAGAVYNASYSVFRLRGPELRLFTFNAAPHLMAAGLRTHR